MEKFKILALDESKFNHNIDNTHDNSIGSDCELELDSLLRDTLEEMFDIKNVRIESDFIYSSKQDEVDSMAMLFHVIEFLKPNLLVTDKMDFYLNALTKVLKKVFETDDVSLNVESDSYIFSWVIDNKEKMLWLIDTFEKLGLNTKKTFKIVNL